MPIGDLLIAELKAKIGAPQVLAKLTDRLSRAHDASLYRLVPLVVVRPRNVNDIQEILKIARKHGSALTFRAAGTSLSGQAVTDKILVELGTHWCKFRIEDEGNLVSAEPGAIGGKINSHLLPYQRRLGPDPASMASCMIGGIVANNASGMCCGVANNTYHTLTAMKGVLANGNIFDTSLANSDERFAKEEPRLYEGLSRIRQTLLSDKRLSALIRRKYQIKNTMGYSLNAYLDFESPIEILAHLLVGSEGTLGFLSEVTLRTIPEPKYKATAVAYFKDILIAGEAIESLNSLGAAVLEFMDYQSLLSLKEEMKYPFTLTRKSAAILIEFQEEDTIKLGKQMENCSKLISSEHLLAPILFTQAPEERAQLWKLRKGLFPKIGAERKSGTAVVIEDICVPRNQLVKAIPDLHLLFAKHDFEDIVLFGHAKDGNLHFVLCNDFSDCEAVKRYASLMTELADLILDRYGGSLKAEHGTGRNMAPFVEKEWGPELFQIMNETKKLLDPEGLLNPGVVLTSDPTLHLKNLKPLPQVSPIVDKCIECGFCESVCPSRQLSLTPRQRIALQREREHLKPEERKVLDKEFAYAGVDTCAGDSLCSTTCPVGIDTGIFMRQFKTHRHGKLAQSISRLAANHMMPMFSIAKVGLKMRYPTSAVRVTPSSTLQNLSKVPKSPPLNKYHSNRVVFFSACVGRILPNTSVTRDPVISSLELCGYEVITLKNEALCCGQAFLSKGFDDAAQIAANQLLKSLWSKTDEGKLSVVCDTSPCTARLWALAKDLSKDISGETPAQWNRLEIHDFHTLMARKIIPSRAHWPKLKRQVILHPTCSSTKYNTVSELRKVAETFAEEVIIPQNAGCCGFAGDKGFLLPELTACATTDEAAEIKLIAQNRKEITPPLFAYSTCQTCSLGMSRASGLSFASIAELCRDALQSSEL